MDSVSELGVRVPPLTKGLLGLIPACSLLYWALPEVGRLLVMML